ncbi:MAG: helix-turn-helix transcriptional regulator [Coriobacteriales bacterium]|nr:helix-turn-helix transcriptional regulator [Coriobacteriales bacterium]
MDTPRMYVALLLALTLGFLGYWLLNYYVFPLFDLVFIWAREVSAATGGLTLVVVALIAAWKPALFGRVPVFSVTLSVLLAGALLIVSGFYFSSTALLLIGAWLSTAASGVVSVLTGIACTRMDPRGAGISIAAAYVFAYVLRWLFVMLPDSAGFCAYIAAPLIALALIAFYVRPLLGHIFSAEPPVQAAITRPASFLPFGNQVFVCLILFRFVYGYMLTFGEVGRVPLLTAFTIIPLAVLLIVKIFKKGELNPDRLFPAAVLFIVASFLALPIATANNGLIVNTLLSSGVGFFEVLLLFIFVALGSKNRAISFVVLSWAYALNSLATLVGANFGRFINQNYESNPIVVSALVAVVVLAFVAYILIALKDFSFMRTIEGLESAEPSHPMRSYDDTPRFQDTCNALSDRYDLTAREREVFCLLARGRNSKVIQEELCISYNTAKAHVRHVYTKLGVHTQQALIDLTEK